MNTPSSAEARFNHHILLVEDDYHIARLIVANIQKIGMTCHHAADGEAGFFAFKERQPSLILLDVMLPDTNGYELCSRIRNSKEPGHFVPIIMLTARTQQSDELHGLKVGADDYITKPFDPQILMARIVAHLRRVYRYDAAKTAASQSVPADWRTCPRCRYMGPNEKFEELTDSFVLRIVCPHCSAHLNNG